MGQLSNLAMSGRHPKLTITATTPAVRLLRTQEPNRRPLCPFTTSWSYGASRQNDCQDSSLRQSVLGQGRISGLRRQGERRRAASHLQAAFERYSRLRAVPFVGRCGDELAACGLHPARRIPGPTGLSPREQAVVRLLARGLTNRQIAAELVISVKTVEYHLGNAFTKFGVSTRTQLAAQLEERRKD